MMKIFLVVASIAVISNTQVLGIDFGTQFWKASIISPGKNLVIVQNSRSGRKSINGISFHEGIRHFQDDALYKRLKKPQMSYFYLNKLLRSLDSETPLEGHDFENGTYYISQNEDRISLEQLVGMILKRIKSHAGSQAGSEIKDTVLSIPANWGWKSKMALINAAYIADLSILGLINENSAAAINYAITRNDTDPINIGFFNLGSHNLQFSIIQFFGVLDEEKGKNVESLKVLSHVVAEDVGGLKIDTAIANYLADEFLKKHQVDPRTKEKSYTKLLHKSSEIKEILSANKETQVYIEGLISGIDLNLPITRAVIEEIEVFKTINKHLDAALEKASISKEDLNSVQMIGGASRIPLVSKIVKQHFEQTEVGSHINGDEAMAFGSSLRAANLSITFRVKQLHFYDGFDEDIRCVISGAEEGVITEKTLFTHDSQHGHKAEVSIPTPEQNIKISLYYGEELFKEYISENITEWRQTYNETVYNFTEEDPSLSLSFLLTTTNIADLIIKDSHIRLTLNQTFFKEEDDFVQQEIPEEELKEMQEEARFKKEKKLAEKAELEKKKAEEALNKENEEPENAEEEVAQEKQNGESAEEKQNGESAEEKQNGESAEEKQNGESAEEKQNGESAEEKDEEIPRTRLKKVTKEVETFRIQNMKVPLTMTQNFNKYPRFTKEKLAESKEILARFEKHENQLNEKSKIRNNLESTLYSLKDHFDDKVVTVFGKPEEIENLKKVVAEKLEWMDENQWTAQKNDFEDQYNQVFKAYEPIHNRSTEYREREKTINETIEFIGQTYYKTQELNKTHPWLAEKVEQQLIRINTTAEDLMQKLRKQMDSAPTEDPLVYNNEFISAAQKLREEYYLIKMLPRPKIVKPKVQVETKKQAETTEEKEATQKEDETEKAEDQVEESEDDVQENGSEDQAESQPQQDL